MDRANQAAKKHSHFCTKEEEEEGERGTMLLFFSQKENEKGKNLLIICFPLSPSSHACKTFCHDVEKIHNMFFLFSNLCKNKKERISSFSFVPFLSLSANNPD